MLALLRFAQGRLLGTLIFAVRFIRAENMIPEHDVLPVVTVKQHMVHVVVLGCGAGGECVWCASACKGGGGGVS